MWASVRERWRPYIVALAIYGSSPFGFVLAISFPMLAAGPPTPFYHRLLRWDSDWYATILNEGYKYNGNDLVEQTVVFYPLYPLIAKALTVFPGIDGSVALLVVANVAAIVSVLLLF